MAATPRNVSRRFLIPEVVQTSEMDCGPAALSALLGGFYIHASYGRLREACQTSVDGTSIDTLEVVANQLGLDAEQILLPADHLLLDETHALPALMVVRLPTGLTHFVVVWNCVGPWVQVMDPGIGRRWVLKQKLLDDAYSHTERVTFEEWRAWVGAPGFLNPLRRRMRALRVPPETMEGWIARAQADTGWETTALLDASVRMTTALVRAGGILPGPEATATIRRVYDSAPGDPARLMIPPGFWSAVLAPGENPQAPQAMMATGVVIVRVLRRRAASPPPPALVAVLEEPQSEPFRAVFDALRVDGYLTPSVLLGAIVMASLGVLLQAFLFQVLLQIGALTPLPNQQLEILAVSLLFLFALFAVELPVSRIVQRMGRRLETRLRVRFLEKLPRLSDSYFNSRLPSDMVMRAQSLSQLRTLPEVGVNLVRLGFQLLFTLLGIIWLEPSGAGVALGATAVFLLVAYLTRPLLQERDLRVRSHVGGLSRYMLDALRGLIPLKMHGAERAYRRDFEGQLMEWARATQALAGATTAWLGFSVLIYSLFAIWLVFDYIARQGTAPGALLIFYWVLSLPQLATALVQTAQQYPNLRNLVLRILEPLDAPNETGIVPDPPQTTPTEQVPARGVAIEYDNVGVEAGGHTILHDLELRVHPGEHIAIVGPSGAGKSSLAGVLLGWRKPFQGECRVDGELLRDARLLRLRRETVWVDPDVRIWNQTLWDNLTYGNTPGVTRPPRQAIQAADLLSVVERLETGVETVLGEGGGLVSGGEGQRVRLARGMTRAGVRLVILDEPFRGLDRDARRRLLERARTYWRNATLLCITHDVGETLAFERVLVIEQGRIVEDAPPHVLAATPDSRYRAMLDGEEQVRHGLWQGAPWRYWDLENGVLYEKQDE